MDYWNKKTVTSVLITFAAVLMMSGCSINIGKSFNFKSQKHIDASAELSGTELIYTNLTHTDLTVTGQQINQCIISADLTVHATSQEVANEVSRLLELKLVRTNDRMDIVLVKPEGYKDEYSVSGVMTITAPQSSGLDMTTTHGDCRISNFQNPVSIRSTHGDFHIEQIQGNLKAVSTHGDISIKNVTNNSTDITTTHGKVSLENVQTKTVKTSTTHDPITLQQVSADSLNLKTSHDPITLHHVSADTLNLNTSHDPIRLIQCKGREVNLKTSHGAITGSLEGTELLTAKTTHSHIKLTCIHETKPEIIATLSTTHGSIEFAPPVNFAGAVNLTTSHGRIQTDRPILVQNIVEEDQLNGSIGQGQGTIIMTATHGNLTLK